MEGRQVVQWDKEDCEELGLVKVDFLGLGMMAVMQDSFELCRRHGQPVELHKIPLDDPATFTMMRRADTIGPDYRTAPAVSRGRSPLPFCLDP